MSAEQFLDRVQATGMVDDAAIAKLREQLASSAFEVPAKTVAETLVKKGLLTSAQAQKLLSESRSGGPSRSAGQAASASPKTPTPDDDELGLAPLDDEDEDTESAPSSVSPAAAKQDDLGLAPVDDDLSDDDDEVVMLEDASSTKSGLEPVSTGGLEPVDQGGLEPVDQGGLEPVDQGGLEPVDQGGLEPVSPGGLEAVDGSGLEAVDGGVAPRPASPTQSKYLARKKTARGNVWDSKLLYVGVGALVLMVLAAIALWFSLNRGTAAEMFQTAEEAYRSQSYAQAINIYEKFLSKYPKDPNCSLARVKIGMAQMWQKTEGSRDKKAALDTVHEILPQIETEEAFPESDARAELASILPEIAEGFSEPAKLEQDIEKAQTLVDLAEEAMKLVEEPSYIPTSLRRPIEPRLKKIREDIVIANRNINRTKRLTTAVGEIQAAAKAGDTVKAYQIRKDLLDEYPGLETNEKLVQAVLMITENERALVKVVKEPLTPRADDHPPVSSFPVALASRVGDGTSANANHYVFFLVRGAVYALKASTGELVWRRHVGYETLTPPIPLSGQAGADVIVVDSRHHELLRLKSDTGELIWRLPLEEPFSTPVLEGKNLLLSTHSGRVLVVDSETGQCEKHAKIPQHLQVAPCLGDRHHIYQVGDHSNLYVLDESTLECKEVYYLGHRAGTVVTAPVMTLGYLFIANNTVPGRCELQVLKVDPNGLSLEKATTLTLTGHVVVRPLQVNGRVVVTTDLGLVRVLEIKTTDPDSPVQDAVDPLVASFKQPLVSYSVVDGGRLWIGNDRFTKYEIQSAKNELVSAWIKNERDTFVGPPQVLGDTVFSIRRRQHSPSFTVTARHVDDGKQLWEIDLAAPAALLDPNLEQQVIHAVSSTAELFDIGKEALSRTHRLDKPAVSAVGAAKTVPFDEVIDLQDGRFALASAQDRGRLILYDPKAATNSGRLVIKSIKGAADAAVTTSPVFCLNGLLIPMDNGQVALIDLDSGETKMAFQPFVEAGSKIQWQRPAVLGGKEFVIVDSRRKLYRVGLKPQPKPHLTALAQASLEVDIISPLAAAGDTVYGVVRGAASDTVVSFASTDLAAGKEWPLQGHVIWGPEVVGDAVLLTTDKEGLICFEAEQQRWISKLDYGPLAGTPLEDEGTYVLGSTRGTVWRISAADGSEISRMDAGEPLGLGPAAFSTTQMLLSGSDGTLLIVPALPRE